MSAATQAPVVFGEVLFDCFETGERVLGGAPFNVAWHLRGFGLSPLMVSRVGQDDAGQEVVRALASWGMSTAHLQRDPNRPTGQVSVRLRGTEPEYTIETDQAYDHIEVSGLPKSGGLLYHGTLACRSAGSRDALEVLRQRCRGPVFCDVNLRAPHWSRDAVLALVTEANVVKLNESELAALAPDSGSSSIEDRAIAFRAAFALDQLIVSRGPRGALAVDVADKVSAVVPQPGCTVVDTVGAGDAFSAVCILGLRSGWPVSATLERAQQFASLVVAHRGATDDSPVRYRMLRNRWDIPTSSTR